MVKQTFLSVALAMVCTSLPVSGTPPSQSEQSAPNVRSRLSAVQRNDAGTPRLLTVPAAMSARTAPTLNIASPVSRISSRAPLTQRRLLQKAAGGIELRGTVLESNSWGATPAYGLYNIPTAEGEEFMAIGQTSVCLTEGYDDGNGTYYSTYLTTDYYGYAESCHLTAFNTSDWTMLYDEELPDFSLYAFASAEDPTTGELYACCSNSTFNGYDWVKIDYFTRSVSVIYKELPVYFAAVGCDNDGQFYGVTEFGRFVMIDKTTGEYTEYPSDPIIPSDTYVSSQHGGCVDNANGRFLLTTYDYYGQTGALHSFDLQTGTYAKLLDFPGGEQVLGLYIPAAPRSPLAPAAPEVTATCADGSMTAQLTISVPAVFYDGSDATGETFGYSVSVEGAVVSSGSAPAGESLSVPVTLDKSGLTYFTVILSNQYGESPKARTSCYIGKGTPSAPANVVLTWENGNATLTWDAVTTSSDGGYINPADVTYIVRNADGTTLSSGISETSATFAVAAPEKGVTTLRYSVAAMYDSKSSGFTLSAPLMLGSYQVPASMVFEDETFGQYTVIDVNGDGITWTSSFGKAMISYNFSMPTDDWLISPPFALEANKSYPFKARVQAMDSSYPERIEVMAGRGVSAADMTITVVPPTIVAVTSYDGLEISGTIATDEAGNYNIGFHGISDAGMYNLYILSYEIEASLSGDNPEAVTDLTVTPGEDFALTASVKFSAPAKNLNGDALQGDVEVVVTRDDDAEVLRRSVSPGAEVTFVDNLPEAGEYTYTVTAASGTDISAPAAATVYVGPRPAAIVDKVNAYQSADDKIMLSWTPVTTDLEGNAIDPADVTYDVFSVIVNAQNRLEVGEMITTSPLSATTFEVPAEPSSTQDYIYFAVKAYHRGVGHTELAVGSTVFGTAYPTPHRISGRYEVSEYFFEGWTSDYYTEINIGSAANGVAAQDGDDSYIIVKTPYSDLNQTAYITTGRVSLASVTDPALIFWIYGLDVPQGNHNITAVNVICDGVETPVYNSDLSSLTVNRWNRIAIDLSAYAGKVVRVKILTAGINAAYTLYDNIYIGQAINNDLSVSAEAPLKVQSGMEFNINVAVTNIGAEAASGFDIRLLRDGEEVARQTATTALLSEETMTAMFAQTLGVHDSPTATYAAEVLYNSDEDPSNNISRELTVARIINAGPIVASLDGQNSDAGNILSWTPVVTGVSAPAEVAEGFEDAEPWADEAEGWLFIDADNAPVGGFSAFDIPGVTNGVSTKSFFVWDYAQLNPNTNCLPHSGNKFIAALYRTDYIDSDDWAVSPLLDGTAQTISFYAKSYYGSYPERIEVLYTTGDASDISSYTKLDNVGGQVPAEWTLYSAALPEGATHFAVRSTAPGAYMLMLDDFTFVADKGFYEELKGYNIYCDRVRLNMAPVQETTYTHVNPAAEHTYHVTAVYSNGESELSAPLVLKTSGIAGTTADGVAIRLDGQTLSVAAAEGQSVLLATVDGKTIHSGYGDFRITLAPSTYILTVGQSVRKLIVR